MSWAPETTGRRSLTPGSRTSVEQSLFRPADHLLGDLRHRAPALLRRWRPLLRECHPRCVNQADQGRRRCNHPHPGARTRTQFRWARSWDQSTTEMAHRPAIRPSAIKTHPTASRVSSQLPIEWGFNFVSEGGLEPPRPCGHQPLKLARLPIPPLRQVLRLRPRAIWSRQKISACRGASRSRVPIPRGRSRERALATTRHSTSVPGHLCPPTVPELCFPSL